MKSVLIIASTLMALSAEGKTTGPADSLKISKDISLDEVVVTATKVAKGTPVAYSELTKDELNRRNDGQGIPFLILQSPSVIMTSDAGTGIGYSGFRIRGTDQHHSQWSTGKRLRVTHGLLGEHARLCLFGR